MFSRVLSFFEISTCNRLCFQRYTVNLPPVAASHSTNGPFSIIKEQLQPQILLNLLYFSRTGGVAARIYRIINYNTPLVSGMYKLKNSLLFDDTNPSHPFLLWYCHCFTGALEAIHYVKGTVFISQHLLQASIIVSSLWLIRGNLNRVYLRKAIAPLLL